MSVVSRSYTGVCACVCYISAVSRSLQVCVYVLYVCSFEIIHKCVCMCYMSVVSRSYTGVRVCVCHMSAVSRSYTSVCICYMSVVSRSYTSACVCVILYVYSFEIIYRCACVCVICL